MDRRKHIRRRVIACHQSSSSDEVDSTVNVSRVGVIVFHRLLLKGGSFPFSRAPLLSRYAERMLHTICGSM